MGGGRRDRGPGRQLFDRGGASGLIGGRLDLRFPGSAQHTRIRSGRALLACLAVNACASPDPRQFEPAEEAELGGRLVEDLDRRLYLIEDPFVTAPLTETGLLLALNAPYPIAGYSFKVVDGEQLNAFAVAGGSVYVYRGLLENTASMAEVAAVLAHEIAHLSAGHASQKLYEYQRTRLGIGPRMDRSAILFLANYSRHQEVEADSIAIELLITSGWDAEAILQLFDMLLELRERKPTALETPYLGHPMIEERQEHARRIIARIPSESRDSLQAPVAGHDQLLEALDQMPPPPRSEFR